MCTALLVLILAFVLLYLTHRRLNQNTRKNLPPGPWGLPIVGHLPFVGAFPAKKYLEWKKTYGPYFFIKLGSYGALVLNDVKLIKEAFNREDMCGRVLSPILQEMTRSRGIAWVTGPRQAEHRKFAVTFLKEYDAERSAREFRMQEEICDFTNKLKTRCRKDRSGTPIPFVINKFFRFPIINSLWQILMGTKFEDGDPVVEEFMQIFERFATCTETVFGALLWFFPLVSKLLCRIGCNPLVNNMRRVYEYMARLIEQRRKDYVAGQPQNLLHAYFDKVATTKDPESAFYEQRQEHPVVIGDIFFGAVDTTSLTLDWFLLYMATAPRVQQKLQQEIDNVIGTDPSNVPFLTQKMQMPYTQAVIQEVLRISSIAPLANIHSTTEEVEFHGYTIPKDTIVFPNMYGIHHDPDIWDEPNKFLPERFLGEDGCFKSPHPIFPFSTGKRTCIGEEIARDQIFLFVAHFFKTFIVSCTENAPTFEPACSSLIVSPHPFEVVLQQR